MVALDRDIPGMLGENLEDSFRNRVWFQAAELQGEAKRAWTDNTGRAAVPCSSVAEPESYHLDPRRTGTVSFL